MLSACSASEYESTAPTQFSDRSCTEKTVCPSTSYDSSDQSSTTTDANCVALTACSNSQYESLAATVTSDRACSTISECNYDQQYQPPSQISNRICYDITAAPTASPTAAPTASPTE